jgi:hypothetical protein
MAWAEPKYTRTRVDSAGKKFAELLARDFLSDEQADEFEEALDIITIGGHRIAILAVVFCPPIACEVLRHRGLNAGTFT